MLITYYAQNIPRHTCFQRVLRSKFSFTSVLCLCKQQRLCRVCKTDLPAPLLLNNVKCIKITFMFVDFFFHYFSLFVYMYSCLNLHLNILAHKEPLAQGMSWSVSLSIVDFASFPFLIKISSHTWSYKTTQ